MGKFIPYKELNKNGNWQFKNHSIAGQEWGYYWNTKLITNGKGEGFTIHGGTKLPEIYKLIDALNKRDAEIDKLTLKKE